MFDDIENKWPEVEVAENPESNGIDHTDWQVPHRSFQQRWNDRLDSTKNQLIADENVDYESMTSFAYMAAGRPAGLLVMCSVPADGQTGTPAYANIEEITCHPGSAQNRRSIG